MKRTKSILFLFAMQTLLFTACTNKTEISKDQSRLLKVESMLEIQNVIAAYAMAWDREDTKEFVNHFHKDAIIIDSWHKKEVERYNGVQDFMDARGDEGDNVGGHSLSLVHFKELNDKTASTEVIFNYFWYGNFITSTSKVNIRGSYIDEWVKTEKGWRIMKRIIEHENVPSHRAEQFGLIE
jgi:SnoaL-like protein